MFYIIPIHTPHVRCNFCKEFMALFCNVSTHTLHMKCNLSYIVIHRFYIVSTHTPHTRCNSYILCLFSMTYLYVRISDITNTINNNIQHQIQRFFRRTHMDNNNHCWFVNVLRFIYHTITHMISIYNREKSK